MLTAGTKLGPYEILAPLGAGGMGEVYRARDTRLDRTVAIKVLNSSLVASPDLKARFEREAKVISQLQHPHICVLHDIGHDADLDYLVMEMLEGESLADRLRRGSLPLRELVSIGCDIADALDRAHRAGIIHRDLKPGNVMLTKAGAKLLDFGLAKPAVMGAAAGSGSAPLLSAAMTMTSPNPQQSPLTQQGSLVGTVQYMSPEQIQGIEADARSDIFAFGAVLYEMATGKRPFEGKSQIKVASAILEDDPQPISAVAPTTPRALDRLIRTCLAKSPDERFQSALDIKLELQWMLQSPAEGASGDAHKGKRELIGWIVAAAVVILAVVGYLISRPGATLPVAASVVAPPGIETNVAGRNGPPQISPDGSKIAFVGCRAGAGSSATVAASCSIWVRPLASNGAHEVQGTEGGYYPFWSPDSRELAFFAEGKLKRVSADGGPVQVICDAEDARGGSWGSAGTIVFSPTRGSAVFRVSADGGTPAAITRMTAASDLAQAGSHRWAYFLPDGDHFLYLDAPTASCGERDQLRFGSLDGKTNREVMTTCSTAAFANGRLLYWRDGNLVAQPFDPRKGTLSGAASVVADHVAFDTLFSRAAFSVSENGRVVFIAGSELQPSQLLWHDRDGKVVGSLGEESGYESIAIAPDGKRAAFSGLGGLWVLDDRGTKTRVTSGVTFSPAWSGDGKRVFFAALRDGRYDIVSVAADGSGTEQTILPASDMAGSIGAVQLSSSANGRFLTFVISTPTTKSDVYGLALDGRSKPQAVVQTPANETMPSLSPDGAWVAYQSDQDGRSDVYVTAFPAGGARYQVSTAGGEKPIWSHDGKELYYRAPDFRLMAVAVSRSGGGLNFGAPKPLFVLQLRNLNGRAYDVSPDGRFLSNSSVSTQAHNIELLLNWPSELKK